MADPRPQPTRLKILKGNPGCRRLPRFEPTPAVGIPDPPTWLTPYALEIWQSDAPILLGMRVMTRADWGVFALYCSSLAAVRAAEESMKEQAELVGRAADGYIQPGKDPSTYTRHPLYNISLESGKAALRYAVELGMTPSARTKIQTIQTDEPESKLQKLMGGNG